MKTASTLILLWCLSPVALAQVFIMPEFGRADLNFKETYIFGDFDGRDDKAVSVGFMAGLTLENNIVFAANLGFSGSEASFGIGDEFQVYELGGHVGYAINIATRFRLVPMMGLSIWEFDAEEDEFGRSGDNRREAHGTTAIARLNFEFPVSDLLQLNIALIGGDYDFGTMKIARFGLKYSL